MSGAEPFLIEVPSVLDKDDNRFEDEEGAAFFRTTSGRIFLTVTSSSGHDAGQIEFKRLLDEAAKVPEVLAIIQRVVLDWS